MDYSLIGLLAAAILIIENHDILFRSGDRSGPAQRSYRAFLYGVLVYYITDILWGVLGSLGLGALLFADTTAYFLAMAVSVFLWTRYVVSYLNAKSAYARLLSVTGQFFFGAVAIVVALNLFVPALFWFDAGGAYHAGVVRYVVRLFLILLFLLLSGYTFYSMMRVEGAQGRRYRTIALFGLTMAVMLLIQLLYPLYPVYAAGYMLGTSLLRAFVINDERIEYEEKLEQALHREKKQREELRSAWELAYTDPLTGTKSKLAHAQAEERKDRTIAEGTETDFAVAVFDINGLKEINDRKGHEIGDQLIIDACRLVCGAFKRSPVFRIGGDEFAVLLEGADYENRHALMGEIDRQIEAHVGTDEVVVAGGMADYIRGRDGSYSQVFERADQQMYLRKRELKGER